MYSVVRPSAAQRFDQYEYEENGGQKTWLVLKSRTLFSLFTEKSWGKYS